MPRSLSNYKLCSSIWVRNVNAYLVFQFFKLPRGQTDSLAEGPVNKRNDIWTAGSKCHLICLRILVWAYAELRHSPVSLSFAQTEQTSFGTTKFYTNFRLTETGNPKQTWKVHFNGFKFPSHLFRVLYNSFNLALVTRLIPLENNQPNRTRFPIIISHLIVYFFLFSIWIFCHS